MSVRLSKALRELNIGLQTAVEFLEKKSELGEVKAEPGFKMNDQQYAALVNAFQKDKEVRTQAEKLFPKKPKEKKPVPAGDHRAENLLESSNQQQYKPLGKIDLNNLSKPATPAQPAAQEVKTAPVAAAEDHKKSPAAPVAKPKEEKMEKKEAKPVAAPAPQEPKPVQKPEPKPVQKAEPKQQEHKPQTEVKPAANKQSQPQKPAPAKPEAHDNHQDKKPEPKKPAAALVMEAKPTDDENKKDDNKVFTLKSEKTLLNAPKVNVLGKIDLNALNQSTRPKKKSKEERRREREEKSQQNRNGASNANNSNNAGSGSNGEKRKRERINKQRVDIAAEANKPQQGGGGNNNSTPNPDGGKKNGKKKKNRSRNQKPLEVSEEDVARQVKETLARLTNKQNANKKGAKYRKEKRDAVQERLLEEAEAERKESKTLKLTEFVTVSELATMMNIGVTQVISTLMSVGIMVSINQRLDAETINLVADEFGFKTEYVSAEVQNAITEEEDDENDLVARAPIVTVMGHVDHGKTSLLDYIRKTNVIAGEAGGITQHIGAYNVKLEDGRHITFLDTPGHEAFTAMRARGTQVTDIAIIIIAADDSVMPTTKEAIAHAQAANVPMVFAINKIDKPGANPEKIREDLAQMNLLVEDWGGKYQCQEISAKKGMGVEDLLEKVLLEAEMLDLKANPNRKATGSVIESSLDKGRGYVSTVLVSNGTLKVGDVVIAGTSYGRIKAMFNERNQRITEVKPAEAAIILGLNGAPTAGDSFHIMESESEAREIANKRLQLQREQGLRTSKTLGLEEIARRIARGEFHELNLVVKGDTDGSVEALSDSFIKMSTEKIQVNVVLKAVGQISENDVMMASAAKNATIVGFQVRPSAAARKLADQEGVEINTYSVIYDAIDDVRHTMEGMLDKVKKEVACGQVEVREVYKISKVGTVAGAYVTEGKVHRTDKCRVIRDGIVIHTGAINALKRYKDDVKEVAANFECGISIQNFNDILVGDILETFTEIEVEQKL